VGHGTRWLLRGLSMFRLYFKQAGRGAGGVAYGALTESVSFPRDCTKNESTTPISQLTLLHPRMHQKHHNCRLSGADVLGMRVTENSHIMSLREQGKCLWHIAVVRPCSFDRCTVLSHATPGLFMRR
jgi:hypothetical protein